MSETISRIRERYPAYADRSDQELTLAIGAKYPQYLTRDPTFAAEFGRFQHILNPPSAIETAQRLGIPGAEKLQADEEVIELDTEGVSKPLVTLPEAVKEGLGEVAVGAVAGPAAALMPPFIKRGVGEAVGGLVESMTSPVGAAAIPATILAPQLMIPVLTAEGIKAGAEQTTQGVEAGKPEQIVAGLTTTAMAVAPAIAVTLPRTAPRTAEALRQEARALGETPPPLPKVEAEPPPLPKETVVEPPQPLGIAASPLLARIVERLSPANKDIPQPAVALDTSTVAPDFQPYAASQQIASRPNALGRVPGLAWLFDPRSRWSSEPEIHQAILTRAFEGTVGRAISTSLGQQLKGSIDSAFTVEGSRITNVRPVREGASTFIEDFFRTYQEDAGAYELTELQRAAADRAVGVLREIQALQRRNEVSPVEIGDESPYFPRIRVLTPEELTTAADPLPVGAAVGSRPFFAKQRQFKTEAEGVEAGVTYEPSIERRLVSLLDRSYKTIADKRLAQSEPLASAGEGVGERLARYRSQFAEELAEGTVTESQVQQLASTPRPDESFIHQPAFMGKIFPARIANKLNRVYGEQTSRTRKTLASLNSAAKAVGFGLDWAAPFLQGQQMYLANPVLWGKATGNHFRAFAQPDVMARYLQDPANLQAMRELSQLGVPLGQLEDFVAGLQRGQPIQNFLRAIPGGKVPANILEAFARSFQTFTETAAVELWKAHRDITPREQWPAAAESIGHMLLRGRMEEIGVTPGQALLERVIFLAPSYLRGGANLVAGIGQAGVSGAIARKAVGAWMAGGTMISVAGMLAAGLSWDEIEERLNPSNANFLTVPVQFPDKRTRNIGLGGVLRSFARLFGELSESAIDGDTAKMTEKTIHWLRGKIAPVPGIAWDTIKGQDFLGNDISPWDAALARVTPLSLQQLIQRPGEPPATLGDVLPSVLGINVWPESISQSFERARGQEAIKAGFTSYEAAPLIQQWKITHALQQKPEFQRPKATAAQINRAKDADLERQKRLQEALPEPIKEQLKAMDLQVTGYDPVLPMGQGQRMPLTRNQVDRYEVLINAEYASILGKLLEGGKMDRLEPSMRREVLVDVLTGAKQVARAKLMREMQAGQANQE